MVIEAIANSHNTDSKTGKQQRILVEFSGHRCGILSLKWTLVDLCDGERRGVPKGGLEPPCPFEHNALNVACLPISPLRLEAYDTVSFEVCQYLSGMVIHSCRDACYNYSDFLNILESGSFYA